MGNRGKLDMQPVRQDISHGASGGIPLAHTMTLDLWFLERDRKTLCYIKVPKICDPISSPKTLLFLWESLVLRSRLSRSSRDPELPCDTGNTCLQDRLWTCMSALDSTGGHTGTDKTYRSSCYRGTTMLCDGI